MLTSILIGIFCLLVFFILSLLLVVGAKSVLIFIKTKLTYAPKKEPPKKKKPTSPRSIRSISINPEEIDRIYVKKAS